MIPRPMPHEGYDGDASPPAVDSFAPLPGHPEAPTAAGPAARAELVRSLRDASRQYGRTLPAKLHEIEHMVLQALSHPFEAAWLRDAITLSHRLRGAAASYGFAETGEAVGRIEDLSVRMQAEDPVARLSTWLEVQRCLNEAAVAATYPAENAVFSPAPSDGALRQRVLVVNRDLEFVQTAQNACLRLLAEVVPAASPAEALEKARSAHVDAAVLDLEVGGPGDCAALVRDLRAIPGFDRLPVAFVAARTDLTDRVGAARAGATLFLEKPLDPPVFEEAVHLMLALRSATRPHALVVDDDPDFLAVLGGVLSGHGLRVTTLGDPMRVLETLDEVQPDILLLDVRMPGVDGLDVCRMLRTTLKWQSLPVLLVTAHGGVVNRVAAFQAGADDFLGKPVVPSEVLARVRVHVERARLLRERSERDALTGYLLRRSFLSGAASRLADARRHRRSLTISLMDVDDLRGVNERCGHVAGDRVLSSLASFLSICFRTDDLKGRWGGDEFALACYDAPVSHIGAALRRALDEFTAHRFVSDNGAPFYATFSAGAAGFPEDGSTLESLLHAADRRLLAAKKTGRGRVEIED